MRTRLAVLLLGVTLAGGAWAETALDGDGRFGLFAPDGVDNGPEAREAPTLPSFAEPPKTGINLRGSGRFGLLYEDLADEESDVTLSTRLRLDIDVSHETDSGVVFGGRIRAEGSAGEGTTLNAPQISARWN
jgi:hypothetical protein